MTVGVPPFGSTKTIAGLGQRGRTRPSPPSARYAFPQRREEKHLFTFAPTRTQFVRLTYPDHYDEAVDYNNTFAFTTECQVYAPSE